MGFKDVKELNRELESKGYKFLGWQNGWLYVDGKVSPDKHPEYCECLNKGHNKWDHPDGPWASYQHNSRGSENTVSCNICKIYWKYDCSD